MAFKLANRAFVLTATTGTGSISLGSVVAGYQSFSAAGITDGDTVRYTIEDGTNWEIGTGTLSNSVGTMARSVIDSSGGGSALTLSGNAKVFLTAAADDILVEVVDDTTPQLGGNLDVQAREITTSTSNGNVKITPNGSGVVEVKGAGGNDGTLQLNCSANSHGVKIKSPPHSAGATYTLTLPNDDGTSGQSLTTNGSGVLSFTTISTDPTRGTLTKSFTSGETASITLSAAVSPTPVVSATKEVPQAGISSKGAWDVASNGANYDRLNSAYNTTLTPSTAYPLNLSTYTGVSDYIGNYETAPTGLCFNPNGTEMFIIGSVGDDIHRWALSTAWDVSTANEQGNSFYLGGTDNSPMGLSFNPDGSKFFVTGGQNDRIYQYTTSSAYSLSSPTLNGSFYVRSQATDPQGHAFNNDGTKMYVINASDRYIYEYDLSSGFDLTSTVTYNSVRLYVLNEDNTPREMQFNADGTKFYLIGSSSDKVHQYSLTTAFSLSTASYDNIEFSVSSQENAPTSLFLKPDNTKFYIVGFTQDTVYEYDIPNTEVLNLGTGSFASGDIGKTIEGNNGVAVLTAADGSYVATTAFTDSSTIAAGSWSMSSVAINATNGLEMSNGLSGAWDVSQAVYVRTLSVSSQNTSPEGVSFKPDGTKMYIVGSAGSADSIYEYNLSTAWNISTAVYSQAFSLASQGSIPRDVFFKPDGLKMYVVDDSGNEINEYNLSTAWDISTSQYVQNKTVGAQASNPFGVFFKPDGLKMFVIGYSNAYLYAYTLSTAWDISTASYNSVRFDVSNQETSPTDIFFKPDGLKMYVLGMYGDDVNEYNLSTAWNITTASYSQSFSVAGQETDPRSVFFHPDGIQMYVVGVSGISVKEYSVGTVISSTGYAPSVTNSGGQIDSAFWTDINSMTTDEIAGAGAVHYAVSTDNHTTWSVIKEGTGVRPIARNNSGTWQYNSAVSITNAWSVVHAVYSTNYVITQDTSVRSAFFKPDGTKMYVGGTQTNYIYEYNLGTAWDVSTSVYSTNNKDISAQVTNQGGLFFKPDGTKMYMALNGGTAPLNEYNLGTAWDVSTAVYSQNKSLSSQTPNPQGIFFRADGLKLYVIGTYHNRLYEYTLSTAWDVSTFTFVQYKDVSGSGTGQDTNPVGLFFKDDGLKVYFAGETQRFINEYTLSTAWDISTASYTQRFDFSSQEIYPKALSFKPDGSKMVLLGEQGNDVNEYNVGTQSYTTSTTWANSTTNSELYALQQALTSLSINRMDKTQLEAVTDPNHYTLGDSLDLMIGLYLASASSNVPSSDGVSINYDAATINQGAILGTDYNYDFPSSTTVRVTSSAAQNLKIRVV